MPLLNEIRSQLGRHRTLPPSLPSDDLDQLVEKTIRNRICEKLRYISRGADQVNTAEVDKQIREATEDMGKLTKKYVDTQRLNAVLHNIKELQKLDNANVKYDLKGLQMATEKSLLSAKPQSKKARGAHWKPEEIAPIENWLAENSEGQLPDDNDLEKLMKETGKGRKPVQDMIRFRRKKIEEEGMDIDSHSSE